MCPPHSTDLVGSIEVNVGGHLWQLFQAIHIAFLWGTEQGGHDKILRLFLWNKQEHSQPLKKSTKKDTGGKCAITIITTRYNDVKADLQTHAVYTEKLVMN